MCRNCDTIDDPYDRVCVPDKEKHLNVKVFLLVWRVNDTKYLVQHGFLGAKVH